MSKQLVHELTYDAGVDEVVAMLGDPEFRKQVCHSQGVTRVTATVTPSGEGKDVVIDQWQPTAGLPSVAKKIVGDETNIVQSEHWTSPTQGDLTVVIPGKPGDMRGTIRLTERDGGVVETVEMTIKVGIPLVGGKLEGIISDLLLKALKAENRAGRTYLAG